MCLLVMMILFLSTSLFVQAYQSRGPETFSVDDVIETKLLVLNDENEFYHETSYGVAIRSMLDNFNPLLSSDIERIHSIEHVQKVYDYYIFVSGGIDYMGYALPDNSLTVFNHNQTIETSDNEYIDYDYSIVPFYSEEKSFEDDGIYINQEIANIYHLEIGDEVELTFNVPYAMVQHRTTITDETTGNTYHPIYYMSNSVTYQTKVKGITEANSSQQEIYMSYQVMKKLIDEQVKKYKNNEFPINTAYLNQYYQIMDLQPYAKTVFVDKKENVLKVQNEISAISNDLFVYSEYQSVLELMEENEKLAKNSLMITCFGGSSIYCWWSNH